ncbi:allantoicase [Pseudonocardia abyssalis]|uniref:allantoicase n=1 Tax=Pseudonocardia abyssalis TaxID=2792008 RepID=UPI001CF657D5|nr:allantoicase [Pseudonocardia abyssalis]
MTFVNLPDLAARSLGGAVVEANDDFFADRAALVEPYPVREHPEFGYRGKVYDGWETRRRRESGVDHAVVRLGAPGIVHGVVVDTAFFRGNYPPEISVDGTAVDDHDLTGASWTPLVPRVAAKGDTANAYDVDDRHRFTHLRLTMHPDGGVARFRVHGEAVPDPRDLRGTVDVAALENGSGILDCSNLFYSSPANLLLPGPARNMGEGWETARRRDDGNDWVLVALAGETRLRDIVFDTGHFLGNAPGWVEISDGDGTVVVPKRRVQPDTPHRFRIAPDAPPVSRLRVDIHPDGGFARLRAHGELTPTARATAARRFLDALPEAHLDTVRADLGTTDPDTLLTTLTT